MMALASDLFDVCVVGAGVEGSSTARYLASRGKSTLLLEQFPLPHCRGSSHGQSRLVRYGYSQSFCTSLMPEAFEMWSEVEKKAGKTLIRRCGLLTIDEPPYDGMSRIITNVRGVGQECLQLTGDEINKRFPGLNLSSLECGALEPRSGLIQADLAVKSLREQFVEFGGTLQDAEKVLDIQPGSVINIKTNKNSYRAKSTVITAGYLHGHLKKFWLKITTRSAILCYLYIGPWTNNVLRPIGVQIPLSLQRITVCYWPVESPHLYSPDKFPGFIFSAPLGNKKMHIYGFPVFEYPGLIKICPHEGVNIADADNREGPSREFDQTYIDRVAEVIKARFPGVKPKASITESCIYSVTPDHMFVMDRHPKYKNIVIGAGFSGHGFKMAPVVGKILSQMALDEKVSYDVIPFRLSRFTSLKSSL